MRGVGRSDNEGCMVGRSDNEGWGGGVTMRGVGRSDNEGGGEK